MISRRSFAVLFVICLIGVVIAPPAVKASEIHDAIIAKDPARLVAAIKAGANVNEDDMMRGAPLQLAVSIGSVEMAQTLIEAGADIEIEAPLGGAHPLHSAALGNKPALIALLVAKGANLEAKDTRGRTPLYVAATNGNVDAAKALLAAGADPKAINDSWRETPLHVAAMNGNIELAELLLAAHADVNTKSGSTGNTPLHDAAMDNRVDMVRYLVEHGADIGAVNKRGKTPLAIARMDAKAVLVELGAK